MSNYWNLHCRSHSETYSLEWNRGGDEIQRLIPLLPKLAELGPEIDQHTRLDITIPGVAYFAAEHNGCDLIAVDEYGRFHDQCAKYVACKCCGKTSVCRLAHGHEGECGHEQSTGKVL
ncbi:hypothetical protein [Nocardia rhizosphaerae]|uniref:Uncharacterized protein n=1 Tax=Nocardia rhizosphaerae TaxID=1691571 RepID=A0ABV8L329_9NOCA